MKSESYWVFQQSFIIIFGVLPHILKLPRDWENDAWIFHTLSYKYLEQMPLFFKELLKKIQNKGRKNIKIMYYIDTLPVYVTKANPEEEVDKTTKLTKLQQ